MPLQTVSSLHKARSFGICVGRCVRYPLLHMSDSTEMTVHDLLWSHLVQCHHLQGCFTLPKAGTFKTQNCFQM